MKHKIAAALCMSAVTALLISAAASAYRSSTVRVTSRILTGDIDIDIQQERLSEEKEKTDKKDGIIVIPGDIIKDRIMIKNLAETCFIRTKIDFEDAPDSEKEGRQKLREEDLRGIGTEWIHRGEYYYYNRPVQTGEEILFLEAISIPDSWTEETPGYETGMQVTAEAVQSIHFTPDYESEAPWGNTEIELCVHKNEGETQRKEKTFQNLTVTMEGAASRLVVMPPDFFQNFKELMPGDEVSDTIKIHNDSEQTAELFFRTEEPEGLTQDQKELLEHLQFRMVKDDEEIYRGNLQSKELNREISLGTYRKGDTSEVKFYISMPAEDQNWFAVRDTMIHWIFYSSLQKESTEPKTGDTQNALFYILSAAGAMSVICAIAVKKVKKRKPYQ